jgi:hypothetical protein
LGPDPSISVGSRQALTLQRLQIQRAPGNVAYPTRVELIWLGGRSGPLAVAADGSVTLPSAVTTPLFQLRVLKASRADVPVGIGELQVPGLPQMHPRRAGRIRGCDQVAVLGGERLVGLRVDDDIRDLDAGKPVRASGCGRLPIAAGAQRIEIPAATLRPDSAMLTSPAPTPIARTASTPGAVTDAGDPGRGRRDDVKLRVNTPAWLVLGESFDRGWRAWCNDKSLGEPLPIDGYANAWPVEPGCTTARFAFASQRPVHIIQLLSALACVLLLALALGGGRMRRRAADARGTAARGGAAVPRAAALATADWPDPPPARIPPTRAAMAGIVFGAALAFCFSLRSGLLIAPGIAFVLWRGIPAKPLAAIGGVLLAIAVPLDYIVFPAPDFGGYNPGYAGDHISGHWIAVAAWVLLALALWRTLSTASRRRGGPSDEPAA